MTVVQPYDSSVDAIRRKIRRLTTSSGNSSFTTADIDRAINTFYNQDFPYAIKIDQMRSVYTFYTQPYVDRYPLDVNFNQSVRAPFYVDGIAGNFFKDRGQFYNMWPRWPTLFNNAFSGDGVTKSFNFTIPGPFLRRDVLIGGILTSGSPFTINDSNGDGILYYQNPNPIVSVPPYTTNVPGMKNINTQNPGLNNVTAVGTVNYVTGAISFNLNVIPATIPAAGEKTTVRVSQYQPGRPYTLLFWNNYFEIRPIPKRVHKCEIETYLTPTQFLENTNNPILYQWWQYIAYGASMEILRERQDFEGVEGLREGFMRQEALVLERQACEEIGQRNTTIFTGTVVGQGWNNGWGQGWM